MSRRLAPALILAALLVVLSAFGLVAGCRSGATAPGDTADGPLFRRLDPQETGVTFENRLLESAGFNILNYLYYYNGGGVSAGDVNGDGLVDLFFTSNEGTDKLYLNRGDFRFEDVTGKAGVGGSGNWSNGVVMADVNGDGRLDIYVCNLGGYLDRTGRNELFVNEGVGPDGVPRFSERAAEHGLDFEGYATHAAFFDYDRDGDLDLYLLNQATHTERSYGPPEVARVRDPRASDRLYRNEGAPGQSRFVDVSEAAGILDGASGYGLSVVTSDFDGDGWPDVYVGNDFHENDLLYLNNRDGTFRETIRAAMPHTARFSMGADAADLNHDGRMDLVVLDMLPDDEAVLKTSAGPDTYSLDNLKMRLGYGPQLSRNTLQLNRGNDPDGTPRFSDIAPLAGVHATDWSWAALLADPDNDGRRDLYVTNGIFRRPNDLDFINFISDEAVQADLEEGISEANLGLLERMPQVPLANYAFRNVSAGGEDGNLRFSNVAAAWGLAGEGFSNGAVYADLDNDGDLDLVVNNVNASASIYENLAGGRPDRRALTLTLAGEGMNTGGIGARVEVTAGGRRQTAEAFPSRGYLSSVDPRLHLGLGPAERAERVRVTWPDGRVQTLAGVPAGRLTLRQSDASAPAPVPALPPAERPFRDVTAEAGLAFVHRENAFVDFNRERLMPHKLSTEGPALAVGDVNGDGLDDVFVGGAKHQPAALLVQQPDGTFRPQDEALWLADSLFEDVAAAFFDADGDGDPDLYVASGGNEFWGEHDAIRDRLYLNDGGRFRRSPAVLPAGHKGCVVPGDWDGDGDPDLFVCGRVVAREYGRAARSFLLENDGRGRFRDVTARLAPAFVQPGMVADAVWADLDGDGRLDLAIAGEWMPVRVFLNRGGRFEEQTDPALAAATGWWTALAATDLDGDGDLDLVAGNLGLNSRITAAEDAPARLYLGDFDGNGSTDPVLTTVRNGEEYPFATRDQLNAQMEPLRRRYPSYTRFGARTVSDLLGGARRGATVLEARTFATSFIENLGGRWRVRPLPSVAQFAPVYAILPNDLDGDGRPDLLLAGNFFGVRPDRGRYDASLGAFLRGDGRGGFAPVEPGVSGLFLGGEVRAVRAVQWARGGRLLVVARSGGPLTAIRLPDATPVPLAAR